MSIARECFMVDPEYRAFLLTGRQVGTVCELGAKGFGKTKAAFEKHGWDHVSIDLNGLGGALPLDLTQPIDVKAIGGPFDVVTNFGTSEHVEGQLPCWRNIFELCRVGGHIVCCTPAPAKWPNHGKYYPSVEWYHQLGVLNEMGILSILPTGRLNAAVFRKLANGVFRMPDDQFMYISEGGKVGAYA